MLCCHRDRLNRLLRRRRRRRHVELHCRVRCWTFQHALTLLYRVRELLSEWTRMGGG